MPTLKRIGKIVRVTDHGLAFVSSGSGNQRQDFPFTFDKIRRYRGEAAKEIGLHQGVEVQFSETDGLIDFVEIDPAQKS
jgi:hypothetical protein